MAGILKMIILKKRVVDKSVMVQPLHFGNSPFYCEPINPQTVNSDTVAKELANTAFQHYSDEIVDSGGTLDLSFKTESNIGVLTMTNKEELKQEHFPNGTIIYYNSNWYKVVGKIVHGHKFILEVRKCFDDEGHDITLSTYTEHINCDTLVEDIDKTILKHHRSGKQAISNYDKLSMYEKAVAYNIITHPTTAELIKTNASDEQLRDDSDTYSKQLEKERSQLMLMIQNKIDSETRTVEQLTNLLGCNLTTLARITQGKPNYFTLDNLIIYARRLGIELELTVFEKDKDSPAVIIKLLSTIE